MLGAAEQELLEQGQGDVSKKKVFDTDVAQGARPAVSRFLKKVALAPFETGGLGGNLPPESLSGNFMMGYKAV
jgi:hypothetical protein